MSLFRENPVLFVFQELMFCKDEATSQCEQTAKELAVEPHSLQMIA